MDQSFLESTSEAVTDLQTSNKKIIVADYDAFLTNYHPPENPDITTVKPKQKVRLCVINGASATIFFITLGKLEGTVIAVDGNKIQPLSDSRFELAVAQRIDIVVTIPEEGGTFPILAQGEGNDKQGGLILTTQNIPSPTKLSGKTLEKAGSLTNA
ncbi:MAG: hypothetical protein CK425_12470 [Parachlamydia sp.]|nr:MAG: hypothetical protein CK425_12470 [Parachlamydia sp.]